MKVLILGSDSPLGVALERHLLQWGRHEVQSLSLAACRWKSERRAKIAVRRRDKTEIIVDARIVAALDSGELLHEIDLERCDWLAKACQRKEITYLYLSSARVFSGSLERPYTEEDPPDNTETVGQLLLRGETAVRERCERHLILRLGPVFSHRGVNALSHLLGRLNEGDTLSMGNRLRGCPVEASDAARVVAGLLDQLGTGIEPWGTYHYASSDPADCYEFAETLLASASQFSQIDEGAVQLIPAEDSSVCRRILDCSRIRAGFAIKQVPWRGFVADSVRAYFKQQAEAENA